MRTPPIELPVDPTSRLIALLDAVEARRRWYQSAELHAHAAAVLCVLPGDPAASVDQLLADGRLIGSSLPLGSILRGGLSLSLAALARLLGLSAGEIASLARESRSLFRAERAPRDEGQEVLAGLLCAARSVDGRLTPESIQRVIRTTRALKDEFPFRACKRQFATAAVLLDADPDPMRATDRMAASMRALESVRLGRGREAQRAALVIACIGRDPARAAPRLRAIWDGLRRAGLWMYTKDLLHLAPLSGLELDAVEVVEGLRQRRAELCSSLAKAPGRQVGFELACRMLFLERGAQPEGVEGRALVVSALVAAVQAQQAAIIAASSAAAAAAAGGG